MTHLENRVYEYIKHHIGTTFAELGRVFPEHFKGDKEFSYFINGNNIIFWQGLSKEIVEVIHKMFIEQKIMFDQTSYLTYLFDGAFLKIPLYKGRKTKKPRWMPIAFFTMEYYCKVLLQHKKPKERNLIKKIISEHKNIKYEDWKKKFNNNGNIRS